MGGRRKRGWEGEKQGGGVERPRLGVERSKAGGGTARVRLGGTVQNGLGASAYGEEVEEWCLREGSAWDSVGAQ